MARHLALPELFQSDCIYIPNSMSWDLENVGILAAEIASLYCAGEQGSK